MSPPTRRQAPLPQAGPVQTGHRQATEIATDDTSAGRRNQHAEDHFLALLLAGDDTLDQADQLAAMRAAYRWGHERGYVAGFERSFDERPFRLRAQYAWGSEEVPSFDELCRRRGEDHPRGPVDWLTGEPLRNGDTAA